MSKKTLWDDVKEIVAKGQHPVIELPPGALVSDPRKRRGRPAYAAYRGSREHYALTTPGGNRLTCRNIGCKRELRMDTKTITCCQRCENELRERCTILLAILDGKMPAKDLPVRYRTQRHERREKVPYETRGYHRGDHEDGGH